MSVIAVLSWAAALVCIVAILPASSPAAVIGYYRFEEGSGASFLDSSGYGLAGTVNGASFSTDVPLSGVPQTGDPNRFSFNLGSVGNYGLVPYSASLNPTAEITVETWVKLDADLPSFASGFVGRQYGNDNRNSFNLGVRNGNGSIFFEITNAGGVDASAEIFSGLALNQWYHLAGVYDGSEIRLYVDGALAGSSSFSGAIGYAVNRPVLIGGDNEGYSFSPSFFLHGKLDEVRISDTALPPQQFLLSVPEPSTCVTLAAGLLFGCWHTLRRKPDARVLALLFCCLISSTASAVNYELVTVGDAGNAADTTGYGAVPYEYQIGKYDVTIQQYTDFLNAVAATDTYSLYNSYMGTNLNIAGISRSGSSGSYTYSVINNGGPSGNRPITYVSWFDVARFANWMQNGQGSGSTETGAYTLNGATSGDALAKNPGAHFYIPTENEWYKAAYYSPLLNSGSGGYYTYATQSNTDPGNTIGSGANQANYAPGGVYSVTQSSGYNSSQNYLTDVGAFTNSASYYGTFDQSGNIAQWNDLTGAAGSSRGLRGGDWGVHYGPFYLSCSFSVTVVPSTESGIVGFRLASPVAVPEPSTYAMALAGLAGGLAMWRRRRA